MTSCSAVYLGSSRAITIWLHINGAKIGIKFYKYKKQTPHRKVSEDGKPGEQAFYFDIHNNKLA